MSELDCCYFQCNIPVMEAYESDKFSDSQFRYTWKLIAQNGSVVLETLKAPYGKSKVSYCLVLPSGNIINKFEIQNSEKELSVRGKLTVKFGVKKDCVKTGTVNIEIFISALHIKPVYLVGKNDAKTDHLNQLLQIILINPQYCDLKIKIGSVELNAHKKILSGMSSTFQKILEKQSLEDDEENCMTVTVKNYEVDVVKKMIEFIYKGHVDISNYNMGLELLKISDEYDIQALKSICIDYLKTKTNPTNVLSLLLSADAYNAPELKAFGVNFFLKNPRPYKEMDFGDILKTKPELLAELLSRTVKHQCET